MHAKSINLIDSYYNADMKTGRPAKSDRSDFGKRIQQFRETAGLSQREVAEHLGISQPSYAGWERRNVGLTLDQLEALASIFKIDVPDFFLSEERGKRQNGPVGRAKTAFEAVSKLPRPKQKKILDVVEALLVQAS
ncbi:helix-turn-helix domain-containing protein [Puniceicoccaceae bacterium K14]|nr:helix-turn-helix domain-containing protein [Puniceicoccaceae bacterium K14]